MSEFTIHVSQVMDRLDATDLPVMRARQQLGLASSTASSQDGKDTLPPEAYTGREHVSSLVLTLRSFGCNLGRYFGDGWYRGEEEVRDTVAAHAISAVRLVNHFYDYTDRSPFERVRFLHEALDELVRGFEALRSLYLAFRRGEKP